MIYLNTPRIQLALPPGSALNACSWFGVSQIAEGD